MTNAKKINFIPVNGKRNKLSDVVPLKVPYTLDIFPIYACNFRCKYCIQSVEIEKRGEISHKKIMDYELLCKLVDDAKMFGKKIKAVHFAGYGEPLLHPDIGKMVKYFVDNNVSDIVDIVSNGALLNPKISTELLDAGLNKLRVSLQGLDDKTYENTSGVKIDFKKIIHNITQFKQLRDKGNYKTKIYVKIIDFALDKHTEEEFYELFSPICDLISVEHLAPLVNEIKYDELIKKSYNTNLKGNEVQFLKVCPRPFYSMMINPDGDVSPCCNHYKPIILGNIKTDSIVNIWKSKIMKNFQSQQLMFKKNNFLACKNCENISYQSFPEDNLDNYSDEILNRLYLRC